MIDAQKEAERMLETLRRLIRERGFTQLKIQLVLGWGRSYISQLLTKQKTLRVEPLLQIVDAIGMQPAEFFAEHYRAPATEAPPAPAAAPAVSGAEIELEIRRKLDHLQSGLTGLVRVLVERRLIGANESAAVLSGSFPEASLALVEPPADEAPRRRRKKPAPEPAEIVPAAPRRGRRKLAAV
jgi:transcriptional regulator with XRE-family HTH domain